ncbi:YiiD C-terminal domain-containing protein [Verrucomicrobiaceae bacterium 227]
MNFKDLQNYLYNHIPLTQTMQVEITEISKTSLTLTAPLEPNINHQETAFGGSASALCILSAWSFIHCRLKDYPQFTPGIVIQRNTMEYTRPVPDRFQAQCTLDSETRWDRLIQSLERKGIGRIQLTSTLLCHGEESGYFEGSFVISVRPL